MFSIKHKDPCASKRKYRPFVAPLTSHPCIQLETLRSFPEMDWLIIATDHNHTIMKQHTKINILLKSVSKGTAKGNELPE